MNDIECDRIKNEEEKEWNGNGKKNQTTAEMVATTSGTPYHWEPLRWNRSTKLHKNEFKRTHIKNENKIIDFDKKMKSDQISN